MMPNRNQIASPHGWLFWIYFNDVTLFLSLPPIFTNLSWQSLSPADVQEESESMWQKAKNKPYLKFNVLLSLKNEMFLLSPMGVAPWTLTLGVWGKASVNLGALARIWYSNATAWAPKGTLDMWCVMMRGLLWCLCVCWSPLLAARLAELRRAQLNGIGRMHMKGASGCRQTVMNDPGAQQPSQIFLTWVKARPQHRELRALLLTNSVWVL